MAESTLTSTFGQDASRREVVPVVFKWLTAFGVGQSDQPGQWSPFLAGPNGVVYVQLAGGASAPTALETLELDEQTYTPGSDDLGLLAIGLTWGWDDDNGEYTRIHCIREPIPWNERALATAASLYRYDFETGLFDRYTGNSRDQILGSAARTTETTSDEQTNLNHRAAHFIVDVTAIVATPSITVNIEAQDTASSVWYPILISAAITATGTTVLKVGPGYTPVANLTANDSLPYRWRVRVEHADADSITYSVGVNLFVQ